MTYNINQYFYSTGFKISILLILIVAGICLLLGLLISYFNKIPTKSEVKDENNKEITREKL